MDQFLAKIALKKVKELQRILLNCTKFKIEPFYEALMDWVNTNQLSGEETRFLFNSLKPSSVLTYSTSKDILFTLKFKLYTGPLFKIIQVLPEYLKIQSELTFNHTQEPGYQKLVEVLLSYIGFRKIGNYPCKILIYCSRKTQLLELYNNLLNTSWVKFKFTSDSFYLSKKRENIVKDSILSNNLIKPLCLVGYRRQSSSKSCNIVYMNVDE